jgi:hypothetical protein
MSLRVSRLAGGARGAVGDMPWWSYAGSRTRAREDKRREKRQDKRREKRQDKREDKVIAWTRTS